MSSGTMDLSQRILCDTRNDHMKPNSPGSGKRGRDPTPITTARPRPSLRFSSVSHVSNVRLGRRTPTTLRDAGSGDLGESSGARLEDLEGIYVISVAARMLEMHPQTLRKYERAGLVTPIRTVGMLRLYSEEDMARLRLIKHLVGDLGLNLAGVQLVLDLFNQLLSVRTGLNYLEGKALTDFLEDRLHNMFALLSTDLR